MIGDATNTHDVSNKANKFTSNHQRTLRKNNLVANQQQWRVEKQNCMFFFFKEHASVKQKCNNENCSLQPGRLPGVDVPPS